MMEEKKCSCCGETKCVMEFNFNTRAKDGLMSICKSCNKQRSAEWQDKNRDKATDSVKRYRQSQKGQFTAMLRRMAKKEQHDSSIR